MQFVKHFGNFTGLGALRLPARGRFLPFANHRTVDWVGFVRGRLEHEVSITPAKAEDYDTALSVALQQVEVGAQHRIRR